MQPGAGEERTLGVQPGGEAVAHDHRYDEGAPLSARGPLNPRRRGGEWTGVGLSNKEDPVLRSAFDDNWQARPKGEGHRFRTAFETAYQPGELEAIAYRGGEPVGRISLRSATGPVRLRAEADRPTATAHSGDLVYVTLALTDADGTLHAAADRMVNLEVTGAGTLLAFGSADPCTQERCDAKDRRTYQGRAIAVIRPTGVGEIWITATAPGCDVAQTTVTAT
ncbi:hypothetical protein GCM10010094_40830 [Streptomyces flaveus]|uniref:Uncharacterized protein n=1 Tax=Streptomyces flaveus TaxID=66370 RepID=A0A917QXI5_9ACTN|nr:hypothetical protein GCM10010094_40830 [Streptomyces flaveus]